MRKMNDRNRTFLLITIPILALFICFNTVPLIRGVYYSFTVSYTHLTLPTILLV